MRLIALALPLEGGLQACRHAIDVMLIHLGLNLIAIQVVDLPNLRACRHALAEHHVQEAQFAVDGRLDGEVFLAVANHQHIDAHVLKALAHLRDFHRAVEAVLLGAVAHEAEAVVAELVVLFGLQEVLAGDEAVVEERLLRLVAAAVAAHLGLQLHLLLFEAQFLLLHLDHRVAQDVLLLGEFGLGVEDLHVKVLVAEDEDDIAGLDAATFLGDNLLHHAALQGADLDGGHRGHLSADADVVVELARGHRPDADVVGVDAQFGGIVAEDEPQDEDEQQSTAPKRQRFLGERTSDAFFLFDFSVH